MFLVVQSCRASDSRGVARILLYRPCLSLSFLIFTSSFEELAE